MSKKKDSRLNPEIPVNSFSAAQQGRSATRRSKINEELNNLPWEPPLMPAKQVFRNFMTNTTEQSEGATEGFLSKIYIRELQICATASASANVFGGRLAWELVKAGWTPQEAFDVAIHEVAKMLLAGSLLLAVDDFSQELGARS